MSAVLLALGAATPIGLSAASAAAAYWAELPGLRIHPDFVDRAGRPVTMAYVPALDALHEGVRTAALAAAAVVELAATPGLPALEVDLLLALPSPRSGFPADEVERVIEAVRLAAPPLVLREVVVGRHDAAGGIMALGVAATRVAAEGGRPCLVVAADSLVGPDALDWVDGEGRLLSPGNPFGLIPGEGAAAALVAPLRLAHREGLTPRAALLGFGAAKETADVPPGPWLGRALSRALLDATKGMAEARLPVAYLFADLTGEPWRADTLGHGFVRVAPRFALQDGFRVLANRVGDCGAAFGPLAAALAIHGREQGMLGGRHACLCAASAATGARAAVVLDLGEAPEWA